MKKSFKLVSSLCVALLAVGAGVALSGANGAQVVETKAEETKTLYLELNTFQDWESVNAKFSVWSIDTNTFTNFMEKEMEHMYKVDVPANTEKVIFVRHSNNAESPTWENKWNQTENLTIKDSEHDYNACRITGWGTDKCTCSLFPANPVEDGYYLVGTMNSWTANEDSKMSFDSQKNEYSKEQAFVVDDEFKVVSYSRYLGRYYGASKLEGGEGSAKDVGQIVPAGEGDSNMKVVTAGTYTPYVKAGDNNKIWISAIEIQHTYELNVLSGAINTKYNLVENPDKAGELMSETEIALKSGDVISYIVDSEVVTANAKKIGNNNCWNNGGKTTVCLNLEDKVYVDKNEKTIFCGGLVHDKFYMSVNDAPVELKYNEEPVDPSFIEYYTTGYAFNENDVIKFVDTTSTNENAVVFSVLKVSESSTKGFKVVDDKLMCTAEGGKQTDIYVKFKSGADEVYFGDVSEDLAAAIKFAQEFNTALESVCVAQGQTVVADLQAAWQAQATSFGSLMEAAQTILKDATTEHSNLDIKAFAAKYDYVYSHYTSELEDYGGNFVDRTPVAASPFLFGLANDNSTLITIVVICSVSSITLLGAILLIKRRRNAVK